MSDLLLDLRDRVRLYEIGELEAWAPEYDLLTRAVAIEQLRRERDIWVAGFVREAYPMPSDPTGESHE